MSNQSSKSAKTSLRPVKAMQLFYEVKQQFPAVPDHTITSNINTHLQKNLPIDKLLEVMREIYKIEEPMGRAHQKIDSPTLDTFQVDEKVLRLQGAKEEPQETVLQEGGCNEDSKTCDKENLNINKIEHNNKVKGKGSGDVSENCVNENLNSENVVGSNLILEAKPNVKFINEAAKFSVNNIDQSPDTGGNFNLVKENKMNNILDKKLVNIQNTKSDSYRNESDTNNTNCDKDFTPKVETLILSEDVKTGDNKKPTVAKRPNTLDFNSNKSKFKIQPSEKCKDVFTLLNSPNFNEKHPKALLSEKPPRSPLSAKRLLRNSPVISKKETVSTPSQTTDTLVNNVPFPSANKVSTPCQTTDTLINNEPSAFSPSVNVSINCEMMQSPITNNSNGDKRSAKLELTPAQPWLNPSPSWFQANCSDQSASPRSFTSVNLTLRPPSSVPQDPIDITSQNSSMTYSTSSFDPQRGLQSRLQITVGPGGAQNVTSVRARPNSSYLPQLEESGSGDVVPARAGSLNNLEDVSPESPALLRQQARIDNMRIELRTGYARLVIMRKEVQDIEKKQRESDMRRAQLEVEKQLRMEVEHLKFQVEQLNKVEEILYNNMYPVPNTVEAVSRPSRPAPAPPNLRQPVRPAPAAPNMEFGTMPRRLTRGGLQYQGPPMVPFQEVEGPKWNCSMCTFLNHPSLDHCEFCEMARVLHGNINNVAVSLPPADINAMYSLPGPSNVVEARNEFASLDTNFNNLNFNNNMLNRPDTSKCNDTPNILQSLQDALMSTTSLVALKDIQPQDKKEKKESLKMLKKSSEDLRNFRDEMNHNDSTGSNKQNFQNVAISSTEV